MDATTARRLLDRIETRKHTVTPDLAEDANARKLLGDSSQGARDDAPLLQLMQQDRIAWDKSAKKLVGVASSVAIDESVRPNDTSKLFDDSVEQCMEFAMRYFRTERDQAGAKDGGFGQDWKTQYNIAADVRGIANGSRPKSGYNAFLDGGTVPPRAGDILSLESPHKPGKKAENFHVCIVSKVFQQDQQWYVRVYEANVPFQVNDPDVKKHYEDLPMDVVNGHFKIRQVPTASKGYATDMNAVGWIHPLESKQLPGAVARNDAPVGGRLIGVA